MDRINKDAFFAKSRDSLGEIFDALKALPDVELKDLEKDKTALVIVDMINGFAREGSLKSSRTEDLIPAIVELSKASDGAGIAKLAFADNHTMASPEFGAYPVHCLTGSFEAEVVDEIRDIGGYKLIPKNSTNGFLEEEFQVWLKQNQHIDTYIITGVCTDICIQQFSITLKTWFNMHNRKSRIIVPINTVDTYDLGSHDGDLVHVMALFNMITNGIEVVGKVK